MNNRRILLMHISSFSGHRCASLAIEAALRQQKQALQIRNIDAFKYINPFMEKPINRLYMSIVKTAPFLWDYLYDNDDILRKIKKTRSYIHRLNERKIKKLFEEFKPDIVVCTQAFPCGMVADYKRRHNLDTLLMGVLTDYVPHIYWLNDTVDIYAVPDVKIKQRLIMRGIPSERIEITGIPIDIKFKGQTNKKETFSRLNLDCALPTILIMGGNQGLGPIKEIVMTLNKLRQPVQLVVVCGANKRLYRCLNRSQSLFTKPVVILEYTEQVDELMDISSFIVSKPGGLTTAEALSKSLPIIIVKPLPGQENLNTRFLLDEKIALKVDNFSSLQFLAEELLNHPSKLNDLRKKASEFSRPDSASRIAKLIVKMVNQKKPGLK